MNELEEKNFGVRKKILNKLQSVYFILAMGSNDFDASEWQSTTFLNPKLIGGTLRF